MKNNLRNLKSKNLLIIPNSFPHKNCLYGGVFIKGQIDVLAKYFNKIYVICPTPYFPGFFKNFNCFPASWKKAVNPINYSYKSVSVYFPKFFKLPVNFSRKKAGERAYKAALELISKENIKFDIIHAHFVYHAGYVGAKLKGRYKKPLIITGHGYDVYELPFRDNDFKKIVKYILKSADYVTTVSKSNYKKLVEFGTDKKKITIIPNSYNAKKFKQISQEECKDRLDIPKNKKIIISVGYLEEIKGYEYSIKAMREVINKENDVLYFIIGNGPLKTRLQRLINNLNLNGYVNLVGGKPHDEVPLWMNACDLSVMPSLKESFGIAQIEAMACGKPVVATRNGGSEDIIVNKKLGYLVEPKNPDELAEKILLALDRKWDKEYILEHVKKFESEKIAKETLKIYKKVMN
ncbi:glycosyltransferase family 4 protein [Patescibacteria group bacterium]|nr:glycosyltransferase family 4 protein [Patescibacteria group bacterium]MBU4367846.1 glycosyltransferase family 4 protein [Patescibacteria group bacterium]MBU4462034.1 glycosyltransferase family 4 protein [Patescibacteria group bacterium]